MWHYLCNFFYPTKHNYNIELCGISINTVQHKVAVHSNVTCALFGRVALVISFARIVYVPHDDFLSKVYYRHGPTSKSMP